VIEKARSKEENLPSLRVYRSELDKIMHLFGEYCETVTLSDDEHIWEDGFSELREKMGPRLRKFQIKGEHPTVILTFEQGAIKLKVEYEDGGSAVAENKRADHLFLRLKEYLSLHLTLAARLMSNTVVSILSTLGTLLVGIAIVTSPRPANVDPNAIYVDLKHGLILLVGFGLLALIAIVGTRRTGYYFAYYGDAAEITSFWTRKKDDLVLALLTTMIGAILGVIGTLVVQHFTK